LPSRVDSSVHTEHGLAGSLSIIRIPSRSPRVCEF
jgi:hypothetical protein